MLLKSRPYITCLERRGIIEKMAQCVLVKQCHTTKQDMLGVPKRLCDRGVSMRT